MPQFLGSWEFIVVALVFMALFGAKRLPDSARALGRSMRILKAEAKGMREDDTPDRPSIAPAPGSVPPANPLGQTGTPDAPPPATP